MWRILGKSKLTMADHMRQCSASSPMEPDGCSENSYKCELCKKCLKSKKILNYHMMIHTGENHTNAICAERNFDYMEILRSITGYTLVRSHINATCAVKHSVKKQICLDIPGYTPMRDHSSVSSVMKHSVKSSF